MWPLTGRSIGNSGPSHFEKAEDSGCKVGGLYLESHGYMKSPFRPSMTM